MNGQRWWDVFFGGTVLVLAGLNVVTWVPSEVQRVAVWLILGVLVGLYFAVGRRVLTDGTTSVTFALALVIGSGGLVACSPNMAIFQAIAFPMLWCSIESLRASILASAALSASVFVGFLISLGTGSDNLTQSLIIESLSLVFSIALGVWITRISHLSRERKVLLDELTDAQDQLALLHRESGVTSERERLAREIHDTIAQDLTGLVMLAQRAQRELTSGGTVAETLGMLEDSARNALAETRALVAASAPVGLTGDGIHAALDRLAERFSRETGVTVGVEVGAVIALDRATEVVLLRVAQEGLANVRKHAGAESAVIELTLVDGRPTLEVRDDGTGFDTATPSSGFGLSGMRDRLALVGGSLEVRSSSSGTTVTATLPAGGAE